MGKSEDLLARREAIVPRGVPRVTMATAEEAHGAIITDADGNELIDFAGGIGVMNAGHSQDEVVRAVSEQVARLQHVCIHVATYEPYVALCEKLATLLPHGDATKVLLLNSGAEAVENAVKIARQATGRPGVLCYTGAFHGRTLLGMSLTSKVKYKTGCGPFATEIYRLPFPDHYHNGDGLDEDGFVARELERLRDALMTSVAPQDVAAVIIEPVLGEGGFIPAPRAYLEGLQALCREHGIMLIFDEIQSGFCRTGAWASFQHFGVTPDLSTYAKSMGGGLPISAVVGRAEVMDAAAPGTIGGTYGGNPVACASALATIHVMEQKQLNRRAMQIGDAVRARFTALRRDVPAIGDIRGIGAMIGVEFVIGNDPHRPASEAVARVIAASVAQGVLVISAGTFGNVIRVLSPLVITDEQLNRGLDVVEAEIRREFAPARPVAPTSAASAGGRA
jgi:4-aminobutyrate aminotransferase / (S)-3-amino-2-methylpropionate transaminase / 5-aminovalerate transaminase